MYRHGVYAALITSVLGAIIALSVASPTADGALPVLCSNLRQTHECASSELRVDPAPLGFTYQHADQFGMPVSWEPCTNVDFRIADAAQFPKQTEAIQSAFTRFEPLTGLRFTYRGTPPRQDSSEPVVEPLEGISVRFTDASEYAGLEGSVIALTNTTWSPAADRRTPGRITSADIIIDTDSPVTALTGAGSFTTVMLHEIGHALNLGHVQEPNALMRTHLNRDLAGSVPPAEQTGLRMLYRPQDCPSTQTP